MSLIILFGDGIQTHNVPQSWCRRSSRPRWFTRSSRRLVRPGDGTRPYWLGSGISVGRMFEPQKRWEFVGMNGKLSWFWYILSIYSMYQYVIVSLSKWASVGESELLAQDPSPQLCVAQIRPRSRPSRSGWNWKDTAAVGFSLEFPELTESFPGRNQALKVGQMWGDLTFLRKPCKLIDGCLCVLKWF